MDWEVSAFLIFVEYVNYQYMENIFAKIDGMTYVLTGLIVGVALVRWKIYGISLIGRFVLILQLFYVHEKSVNHTSSLELIQILLASRLYVLAKCMITKL